MTASKPKLQFDDYTKWYWSYLQYGEKLEVVYSPYEDNLLAALRNGSDMDCFCEELPLEENGTPNFMKIEPYTIIEVDGYGIMIFTTSLFRNVPKHERFQKNENRMPE